MMLSNWICDVFCAWSVFIHMLRQVKNLNSVAKIEFLPTSQHSHNNIISTNNCMNHGLGNKKKLPPLEVNILHKVRQKLAHKT